VDFISHAKVIKDMPLIHAFKTCETPCWIVGKKMKKPILTAKELEALKSFPTDDLSLVPKLILSAFEVVALGDSKFEPTSFLLDPLKLSASLRDKRTLNSDASRPIYQLDFVVADTADNFEYEAGDSFGFHPELPEETVLWLQDRLGLKEAELIKVTGPSVGKLVVDLFPQFQEQPALNDAILHTSKVLSRLDFTGFPKKALLRALAECCQDESEASILLFLSSRAGSEAYNRLRSEMLSVQVLLAALDSLTPPLSLLLTALNPLQARYYSCCNKFVKNGDFKIVFSVTETALPSGFIARGICSTWLKAMEPSSTQFFPITKRSIQNFRLPSDLDLQNRPIILIAAGTGISPFIGFLETLQSLNSRFVWLIFGCRSEQDDFIFRDEIESFLQASTLSKLSLALSRDPVKPKMYVQNVILEEADLFSKLMLEDDALCYICGDELTMIKGVNDAISEVITPHTSIPNVLLQWTKEKKIIRDIWV
jgi:sulfite reductase alpha subunit-like flavoprotein